MYGLLPPDVTLDAPYRWQPGMPLLPPADYMAQVSLKRKRDMSAEPKRDPAKRACSRVPTRRSCGSWTSRPITRVSMARHTHSLTTFAGRNIWCRNSSGPWHPTHSAGGLTAAHLTSTAGRPWSCHHSPFRVLRTSLMPPRPGSVSPSTLGSTSTAVCCMSPTSNSSPPDIGRSSFCTACRYHGSSRRLAPGTGRVRLTLQEIANSCSYASSACATASESRRIAYGTWTRQLCAWFQQASVGGPKKPSGWFQKSRVNPCLLVARLRHGHTCCKHERRHVDTDCLRGEDRSSSPS